MKFLWAYAQHAARDVAWARALEKQLSGTLFKPARTSDMQSFSFCREEIKVPEK
jgi:hypothetical protein